MDYAKLTATGTLTWSRMPKTSPRAYALMQGAETVGALRWQKCWGSLASGETRTGSWSLKRIGFFNTKVSVRAAGSEQEVAAFDPNLFGGGRIEFGDGRCWRLRTNGLFKPSNELVDSSGHMEVTLKPTRKGAEVVFADTSLDEKTAGLLTILIWYVALLADDDATTTVMLAASTN